MQLILFHRALQLEKISLTGPPCGSNPLKLPRLKTKNQNKIYSIILLPNVTRLFSTISTIDYCSCLGQAQITIVHTWSVILRGAFSTVGLLLRVRTTWDLPFLYPFIPTQHVVWNDLHLCDFSDFCWTTHDTCTLHSVFKLLSVQKSHSEKRSRVYTW